MHLIVGLGNPGDKYRDNRHNIGFMAVDEIARRHGFPPFRDKFNGLVTDGQIDGRRVLLLKPQTFMNNSGQSVAAALSFYKIDPSAVTVIYDELDLPPGRLKVKTAGGNGGHNGLKSIDAHIGPAYHRVRLGIGHPGHKDQVTRHVLGDFAKADQDWRDALLGAIADNAALLADVEHGRFMNKIALATGTTAAAAPSPAPKAKSHIAAARAKPSAAPVPTAGPMADMLKKLFGKH